MQRLISKLLILSLSLSLIIFSGTARAATISIDQLALGKVIDVNGQKFVKVRQDAEKGSQFLSIPHAPVCTLGATGTMQAWTVTDCEALVTPTGTNFTQGPCLEDARDGKRYEIRKFSDGKCWMVDNLKYGGATDACVNKTTFDGDANLSGSTWGLGDCRNNLGDLAYGYLYNWQAVVQDPNAYYNKSYQPLQPAQGICPAGWHLPSGGNTTTTEFAQLDIANGGNGIGTTIVNAASNFWRPGFAYKGTYSGYYMISGSFSRRGSQMYLWSSTQNDKDYAYLLSANASDAYPGSSFTGKSNGLSVRCVKDTTERTMQNFTTADCDAYPTPSGTDYTPIGQLKDERDGKWYEIRKFADGKCWMVDNLAYGGEVDACASKTTFDGCGDGSTCSGASKSGSAWGFGDCRNNPGSSTYGYLYNWQAAMQHASAYYNTNYTGPTTNVQGICPQGWHIPTGNTSGEYQALHTSTGSNVAFWQNTGSWKGVLSGICDNSGSLYFQGSGGGCWSSVQNGTSNAYNLVFNSSNVYPGTGYNNKYNGLAIRCVKN